VGAPSGEAWHGVRSTGVAKGAIAMQRMKDWFFPVSLLAAWTVTTAYTITLISGAWVA